jgi:hypothetical protein
MRDAEWTLRATLFPQLAECQKGKDRGTVSCLAEKRNRRFEGNAREEPALQIKAFAYPYGLHNQTVRDVVKEAGYEAAFTAWDGESHTGPIR